MNRIVQAAIVFLLALLGIRVATTSPQLQSSLNSIMPLQANSTEATSTNIKVNDVDLPTRTTGFSAEIPVTASAQNAPTSPAPSVSPVPVPGTSPSPAASPTAVNGAW
jgi:hypothetical protein